MDKPGMVIASAAGAEAFRKGFCALGPRHTNAYRWVFVLGWKFSNGCLEQYLEPEVKRATH